MKLISSSTFPKTPTPRVQHGPMSNKDAKPLHSLPGATSTPHLAGSKVNTCSPALALLRPCGWWQPRPWPTAVIFQILRRSFQTEPFQTTYSITVQLVERRKKLAISTTENNTRCTLLAKIAQHMSRAFALGAKQTGEIRDRKEEPRACAALQSYSSSLFVHIETKENHLAELGVGKWPSQNNVTPQAPLKSWSQG